MQNSHELLAKVKSYRPVSDPKALEDFMTGTLHLDFVNEIYARIEQLRDFNEECKSNEYLTTRGGIEALRMMITVFDSLLNNRLSDMEEEEDEKE